MLKKITSFWKSFTDYEEVPSLSIQEQEEGLLFVQKCFENQEYQAIARSYKSNPTKYAIKAEYINTLESNLINDFKNNTYVSESINFFTLCPELLSTKTFLNIFKLPLTEEFSNDIFRYNILLKNSHLIKTDKLSSYEFQVKSTCEFLIEKANSNELNNILKSNMSSYLKVGSEFKNEELLYSISSTSLTPFFKLEDISSSPYSTPRLNRTYLSEFRELMEARKIITKNNNANKPVPETDKSKIFVIDDNVLKKLPTPLKKQYESIIVLVKKYQNSKITNDYEDSLFLEKLVNQHLPESIYQYLQVDVDYRDKVLSVSKSTANEIIKSTLDLYISRLNQIGEHLSEVALIKLQSNKLLIERMSNNLELYRQGITEVPDSLEIQAPIVEKSIVRLKRT